MKAFRFRLETLLKVRAAARDERRTQLAEAQRAQRLLAEQQAALNTELNDQNEQRRARVQPGRVNVDDLHEAGRYTLLLKAQAQSLAQKQQLLTTEVERRRMLLVEADRSVKVLEKLRERKTEEYANELERQDRLALDEAALVRLGREEQRA